MHRYLILLIFIFFIFSNLISVQLSDKTFAQNFKSQHFHIENVSEGVYAAIHSIGGHAICNAGIVDLGEETLIFDTFLSPLAAEDLLKAARNLTENPVKFVVNSHYHNDHIRGNQVFLPEARIISTPKTREMIKENEPKTIEEEKGYSQKTLEELRENYSTEQDSAKSLGLLMWIGYYEAIIESHPILRTTLPDSTFNDTLIIKGTQKKVVLISFKNGHTVDDVVMYLPEDKILFTGDLVFIGMHPYLADGSPDTLLQILDTLKKFDIEKIIPGHGDIGGLDDIDNMIHYIKTMQSQVESLIGDGKSPKDLSESDIAEPFNKWWFPQFFRINLGFIYKTAISDTN